MINTLGDHTPEQYYNSLASVYDEMTDWEKRFEKERPHFQKIIHMYNLKTALDAGCGTGFHSILLSQLGVKVTAVDISGRMLQQAIKNAARGKVYIDTVQSSFQEIGEVVQNKVDGTFCLGNGIAHVLSEDDLQNSFNEFRNILNTGGILFLQLLNYDSILKKRERIQHIRRAGEKIFIRFYDYSENSLTFNILVLEKKGESYVHSLQSIQHFPWRFPQIELCLKQAGFNEVNAYGTMALDPLSKDSSRDLVVLAS